jgi:hypothetical protein
MWDRFAEPVLGRRSAPTRGLANDSPHPNPPPHAGED